MGREARRRGAAILSAMVTATKVRFTPRRGIALLALLFREAWASLNRNHSLEAAAAMAYYGFFALIPLLLLVVYLASRFLVASQGALEAIESLGAQLFPDLGGILVRELRTLSHQRVWTALGALVLFWSVTPLAATARAAFSRSFAPERPLPLWRAKLRDIAGALTLLAIFLLIVVGRIAYGALAPRIAGGWAAPAIHWAISFSLTVLALSAFFAVLVPVRLSWREVLGGAVLGAALLFVLRPAFAAFLRFNPNYGFAFGSLKAVFLVIVWVYLCCVVLLLAAEIMANVRRRDTALLRLFFDAPGGRARRAARSLAGKFERQYDDGEIIFEEGAPGHSMYFVQTGAVRLDRGGQPLHTVRAGDFFGEISMLIDGPRTAAAVAAAADTRVIEISRENFETILRDYPRVAVTILKELAARLKATDERIVKPPPSAPPPGPSVPT